jgi:3-hydroxyacyl-CoA dehydrogenase
MPYQIRRVAVIGAGTMGAAIAGLVAGTGLPVLLLDVPPTELTPAEQARGLTLDHPAVRNRIVQQGFDRMCKARPSNLFSAKTASLITLGNTEDDFAKLADADWIVEAIIEQIAPKQALMERIEQVRKPGSLVTTNTSGIPIKMIGAGRSEDLRKHLFGTHFFNPPRYLKLLEIIPGVETDPTAVAAMRSFAENTLGKGVVMCKDRPNFVGNRLGIFSMMNDLAFIVNNGYTVEEVDALTGPLIGRPNTASFRLLDLTGIDIIAFVAHNLYKAVPDDESRETYRSTDLLDRMVAAGKLGRKAGQGFYKEMRQGGKREFWPLDLQTLEYRQPQEVTLPLIAEAQKIRSLPERLRFILKRAADDPNDRAAQLIAQTTLPTLAYAARRLPEIADSVADADNAMRWGFAHEMGPFQIWDALGLKEALAMMRRRDIVAPEWVEQLVAQGNTSFYKQQNGQLAAYNVAAREYQPLPRDERAIDLAALKAQGREIKGNKSASLIDLGDGVLCLEFHSKANAVDGQIIELGLAALEELKNDRWVGLVVGNQGRFFGAGASLMEFAGVIQSGQFDAIDAVARQYQRWMMGMRYASKPVVTAPFGQTLGGIAEVAMHSACTITSAETYMGLVEFGVGLIPAAGGCKELNRRLIGGAAALPGGDPLKAFQQVFETISQAKVSTSALEARELGFLRPTDPIVMNGDYLIGEAKQMVLQIAADYVPPAPGNYCYALGRDGLAAARVAIYSFAQAGFASEYDAFIADKLAYVLAGGELSSAQWVDEQYILDLEREAFVALLKETKTHERIKAMLETGKPLRN